MTEFELTELATVIDPEAFVPRKNIWVARQLEALERAKAVVVFQEARKVAENASQPKDTFETLILDVMRKHLRVEVEVDVEAWTEGKSRRVGVKLLLGEEEISTTNTTFTVEHY